MKVYNVISKSTLTGYERLWGIFSTKEKALSAIGLHLHDIKEYKFALTPKNTHTYQSESSYLLVKMEEIVVDEVIVADEDEI